MGAFIVRFAALQFRLRTPLQIKGLEWLNSTEAFRNNEIVCAGRIHKTTKALIIWPPKRPPVGGGGGGGGGGGTGLARFWAGSASPSTAPSAAANLGFGTGFEKTKVQGN